MVRTTVKSALAEVTEGELSRLTRALNLLLNGRPLRAQGRRPARYRTGYSGEFLDFQAYTSGDNLRAIDWRATARSRQIQVRRYWDDGSCDWTICLDRSASMAIGAAEKWRLAIQCTAALSWLMLQLENRVGLVLFSSGVDQLQPPGRGPGHYANLLRLLQAATPMQHGGASQLASCAPAIGRQGSLLIISDFLVRDGMRADLQTLIRQRHQIQVLQILSPLDGLLPTATGGRLHDVESGDRITIDPVGSDPLAPQQELAALCNSLHLFCAQHRIPSSRCDTRLRWKEAVLQHLRAVMTGGA